MNTEHIEIVMNEFSEELKTTNKAVVDMATAFNTLQHKIAGFEEKLANQHLTASADMAPIQDIVKKGMTDALLIAARQPKSLTKKFQILLFPEQDAKLFYKIVFGCWFLLVVIALAIGDIYKLGSQWIEKEKAIEIVLRQQENAHIVKAWHNLYQRSKKSFRIKMDQIIVRNTMQSEDTLVKIDNN
ncbi:hypothetical protein [Deminuibacter soli]|uniref:Uncharacterized protein n=1 Tax=Deminuibacter soli TaxID=2291815 RepID=A0A3E1NQK7_9BACT|nr:hypothetical protein [Deminuibacter soli]RFM30078.1 hypothetical protein DXN05_03645 [Deminuibacter soli]